MIVAAFLSISSLALHAADANDEAIKKDRWHLEGTWRITSLEVNGIKTAEQDARSLFVINGLDGSWALRADGIDISKGTTTLDPSKTVKTIDITPTEGSGKGEQWVGIYELGENTRKLCYAPAGRGRPTEFGSKPGSEQVFVIYEREPVEATKLERKRLEGTWQLIALERDGNQAPDDDVKKLGLTIGADGSWSLTDDGNQIVQGTSQIDTAKTPRTIDFTPTTGNDAGKVSYGVYQVTAKSLKFCVGHPGIARPTEFSSAQGSQHLMFTFERK